MNKFKEYERQIVDPLIMVECNCEECEKRFECFDKKLSENCINMKNAIKKYYEACPEGSKERSGQCAKKDLSGYLKNVCPTGNVWDPTLGSTGKCRPHVGK